MKTIPTEEHIKSDGGRYEIKIGVTYPDEEDPEYEHSAVFGFEPSMGVGPGEEYFNIVTYVHKKYWRELDEVDHGLFTEADGSEIIESNGWMDERIHPESLPKGVKEQFASYFGTEVAKATFDQDEGVIVGPEEYPEDYEVDTFSMNIRVDGSTTEEIDEDDPRVEDGHFTYHVKDADTGKIKQTYHRVSHSFSWWFEPVEETSSENARIQISQCFHKTWDKSMTVSFEEEHPRETIQTASRSPEETPGMDTLPDEIKRVVVEWFGEEVATQSIQSDGGSLPTAVYECADCGHVFESIPRDTCTECSSDSLVRYESMEQYKETSDENKELGRFLSSQEVTFSKSSIE